MTMIAPGPGQVVVRRSDDSLVTLEGIRARPTPASHDARLQRAPYGDTWRKTGSGVRDRQGMEFVAEARSDHIAGAAEEARGLVEVLADATHVGVPFGGFSTSGVRSWSVTPVEVGYRVSVIVEFAGGSVSPIPVTFEGEPVTFGGQPVWWFGG